MFSNITLTQIGYLPIPLLDSETREPNQIIGLQKSEDENYIAVVSGKNLVMDVQKQNQLFIFKKKRAKIAMTQDEFVLHKRIVVKDLPIFNEVCMNFHFNDSMEIIFVKADQVFKINVESEEVTTIYTFKERLSEQP